MHSNNETPVSTRRIHVGYHPCKNRCMIKVILILVLHSNAALPASALVPSARLNHGVSILPTTSLHQSRGDVRGREGPDYSKSTSIPTTRAFSGKRKDSSCSLSSAASSLASGDIMAWSSMSLLAVQFACQPILTKSFVTPHIVRTTYVLAQDMMRFVVCGCLLTMTCGWSSAAGQWTVASSLIGAGLPASLYAIQNYCSLMAYQNLAPISYNVLNQTKTLSAAFFCYALLGKPQSKMQILSLFLLLGSALVMEKIVPIRSTRAVDNTNNVDPTPSKTQTPTSHLAKGVVPILVASLISGLAGTLCQRSLQDFQRNLFLFSMEISAFSSLALLASLFVGNPDWPKIEKGGVAQGWTRSTWIPLLTNAIGGILVGLVTKYADSVRKGFALVIALLLSGLLQNRGHGESKVSLEQWVGGGLAGICI